MNVAPQVIDILARQLMRDPASLAPGDRLDDLGADSMTLVETIFLIEETFDVQVPFNANAPEAGFDVSTVGAIIAGVEALVRARAA
jgi:acyl carrier protein